MIGWIRAWVRRRDVDHLPARWLRERERLESRIEFHSVQWRWPVNRVLDHAAQPTRKDAA